MRRSLITAAFELALTRYGAHDATVILLHEDGTIAMTIGGHDHGACDLAAIARSLHEHVLPPPPPLVAPLLGSRGWLGAVVQATLAPVTPHDQRALSTLATYLSVWCTARGIGALPSAAGEDRLAPRQRLIADRAALGMTNDEIAADLRISVNTVKAHLKQVFEILGVRNRTELVHALRSKASGSGV